MSDAFPPPGSFGLSRIGGPVGWFVWAGQALSGDLSKWTHAFFVLDNGEVIEAEPGGAKIRSVEHYLKMKEVQFCDLPVREWSARLRIREGFISDVALRAREDVLRDKLVRTARGLKGVPYNWFNYPALGLLALGLRPRFLRKWLSSRPDMICSQLVDWVYMVNDIHLFDDGRIPMEVTPGDLWDYVRDSSARAQKGWRA